MAIVQATRIERYSNAFLGGYFGEADVPQAAIRLYEVLSLLERWSAEVSRHAGRATGQARLFILSMYFRHAIGPTPAAGGAAPDDTRSGRAMERRWTMSAGPHVHGARSNGSPAAVVIGLDSITGLQSARVLAGRGIPVIGIAQDSRHPSCRTNACQQILYVNTSGDELIVALERLGGTLTHGAVLFPCTDLSVLATSQARDRLAAWYQMVLPPPGVLERLLNKATFHAYAVAAGLPVAASQVVRGRDDLELAVRTLRFPCALKPAFKSPTWVRHTNAKVFRADDADALRLVYERCAEWSEQFIVQEWIDGPDTAHFTCNAYFGGDSTPLVTFVSQKLRQWPLEGGVGCLSQECRNDDVLEQTVRLFQGVGHRGLAYLELKLDSRTGKHVIIEPNVGRPTGRSAAAEAAGVSLLYTQYCDALGLPLPSERRQTYSGAKWVYLRQDCQAALQRWREGTLTAAGWIRSLRGCGSDAVFSWRDPGPFVADLAKGIAKAFGRREGEASASVVEYDVHGIVGIRVMEPSPADTAAIDRQLGPLRQRLDREPDIVVHYVDELPTRDLRYVEFDRTAFAGDEFFLLRDGKRRVKAKVSFGAVEGPCEIVCQRGTGSVPLLSSFINLRALARGYVAVHASAVVYKGMGVLMPASAHGGKTTGLLAFLAAGAEYVGDEWVLLSQDGARMYGIPGHLEVHDWQVDQMPALRDRVASTRRALSFGMRMLTRAAAAAPRQLPLTFVHRVFAGMRRRLDISIAPLMVADRTRIPFSARVDKVLFMARHDDAGIRIEAADPRQMAVRMAASSEQEQMAITQAYLAHRCAFPDRTDALFERANGLRSEGLGYAIAGKNTFLVYHPSPCSLQDLFDAMAHVCRATELAGSPPLTSLQEGEAMTTTVPFTPNMETPWLR